MQAMDFCAQKIVGLLVWAHDLQISVLKGKGVFSSRLLMVTTDI